MNERIDIRATKREAVREAKGNGVGQRSEEKPITFPPLCSLSRLHESVNAG